MTQYQMENIRMFETAISRTSAINAPTAREDNPARIAIRKPVLTSRTTVNKLLATTMTRQQRAFAVQ